MDQRSKLVISVPDVWDFIRMKRKNSERTWFYLTSVEITKSVKVVSLREAAG
jgi:hypothetical protein